jgi:hypothetical protein
MDIDINHMSSGALALLGLGCFAGAAIFFWMAEQIDLGIDALNGMLFLCSGALAIGGIGCLALSWNHLVAH